MAQSANAVILKKVHETRLNKLIASFSKALPNHLLFSQLLQLLIDRGIFNLSVTLDNIHTLFTETGKISPPPMVKKPSILLSQAEKVPPPQEKHLNRQQIISFLANLAKLIYHNHKNSMDKLYTQLLSDRTEATTDHKISKQRTMTVDQTARKLLIEEAITEIMKYEKDLKACFDCYIWENYQSVKSNGRILLQSSEITVQNKKMLTAGLVMFLKESEICPNLISIEHVEEILKLVVPPVNQKEQHFYYKKLLVELYNDDLPKRSKPMLDPSDPGITFFEFEMLVMRVAWESFPKELEKKGVDTVFKRFFDKVGLRSQPDTEIVPNKAMLLYLKNYYEKYINKEFKPIDKEMFQKNERQEIYNNHRKEVYEAPSAHLQMAEVLKNIDRWLPKLPDLPEINQECLPPYNEDKPPKRITIGQPAPPEEKQEQKQQSKEGKKQSSSKKEEDPPRIFEWGSIPQTILSSEDYLKQLESKLAGQKKNASDLSRGNINIEAIPSLISETVLPTEIPKDAEEYMLSFKNSMVERNYTLALENLDNIHSTWKRFATRNSVEIPPEVDLFLDYNRGSVYCSAGRFDLALSQFINAKNTEGGRISFTNPDRSLPYMGMGEVFYEVEQYEYSARAYLKAREIRESTLGLQHVQTATVFCNLGACFFMLDRSTEALGYTQISENILSSELGPHHQRTVSAKMNLKKIRRGESHNIPQYRRLWEVFEKDAFGSESKKKVEKKKK